MENEPKMPTPDTSPEAEAELEGALSKLEAEGEQPPLQAEKEPTYEELLAEAEGSMAADIAAGKQKELKEIRSRIENAVREEAGKSAETLHDMLKTLDTKAAVGGALIDGIVSDVAGRPEFAKLKLGEARGELNAMAQAELAAALEEKMAGESDEEMVSKLEKTIDALRSDRKAA